MMNQEASSPKQPITCVGRDRQINDVAELIKSCRSEKKHNLMYIGAPKIGKTTLLNCLETYVSSSDDELGLKPVVIVRTDWKDSPDQVSWSDIWSKLYLYASKLPKEQFTEMTDLLGTYREPVDQTERLLLFEKFYQKFSNICILFLLDDLDSSFLNNSREFASEILNWGKCQKNVALVATATYRQGERYKIDNFHTIFREERIYLLDNDRAKSLIKLSLGNNIDNDTVDAVFNLCGGNPFLIESLCNYIKEGEGFSAKAVKSVALKWEKDQNVRKYLDDTWDYLDLYGKGTDARVVLARLASGEGAYRTDRLETIDLVHGGLDYLRKGGVVAPDREEISSKHAIDYFRLKLGISWGRSTRRQWSTVLVWLRKYRWTIFWGIFLFWLIVVLFLRSYLQNPGQAILTTTIVFGLTAIFMAYLSESTEIAK